MGDEVLLRIVECFICVVIVYEIWLLECYDDWILLECYDYWDLLEVYILVVNFIEFG